MEAAEWPRQGDQSPKVLMVLFHFPPLGGVPMPRNVYNVRYLPRFGWTPVVLAPRDVAGATDPDALALVAPDTPILRARSLEPHHFRGVVSWLRRMARILRRDQGARVALGIVRQVGGTAGVQRQPTGKRPLAQAPAQLWRLHRLLAFPDSQVGWLPFAVIAAIRAYRVSPFDVVYSTSAPVTSHLVAGIIKRLTGVPWVAEFRDPWRGNPVTHAIAGRGPWLHRRMQARLERWIVRSADQIVFVSPSTTRLYRRRYPDAATMVTITNGHDRSETIVPAVRVERGRYRIVWTGTLDRPDELLVFLQAVDALLTRSSGFGRPTRDRLLRKRLRRLQGDLGPVRRPRSARRGRALPRVRAPKGRPSGDSGCRRSPCHAGLGTRNGPVRPGEAL